jgi:pyrroline-5-carboxylate reductase
MRLAFIGGGFMGEAILGAALKSALAQPGDVVVADVAQERRDTLASTYSIATTADNAQAARAADLLVLAVKPQEFSNVASGLRGHLNSAQTVVSIMAGVPISKVSGELGRDAIVRVMPNTAAFVGEAISVWKAGDGVSEHGRDAVRALLGSMGREIEVADEKYLDMATAVSGSGPGFVYLILEALIDASVRIGMRREVADQLVVQMLFGSAALARETGKHPAELRAMVTSPGGTTAAGLQVLEDAGVRGAIIDAVVAAHERAKELGG